MDNIEDAVSKHLVQKSIEDDCSIAEALADLIYDFQESTDDDAEEFGENFYQLTELAKDRAVETAIRSLRVLGGPKEEWLDCL